MMVGHELRCFRLQSLVVNIVANKVLSEATATSYSSSSSSCSETIFSRAVLESSSGRKGSREWM